MSLTYPNSYPSDLSFKLFIQGAFPSCFSNFPYPPTPKSIEDAAAALPRSPHWWGVYPPVAVHIRCKNGAALSGKLLLTRRQSVAKGYVKGWPPGLKVDQPFQGIGLTLVSS